MANTEIVFLAIIIVLLLVIAYFQKKISDYRMREVNISSELEHYKQNVEIIAEKDAYKIAEKKIADAVAEEKKRNQKEIELLKKSHEEKIQSEKKLWDEKKQKEIKEVIEKARVDSTNRQRAVLKGKIGEQIAPLLEEFYSKYAPADARFIGHPVDYIIFKNLTRYKDDIKNKIPKDKRSNIEIVIADIKSGSSQLNREQKEIRDAVGNKRIYWDEIRISPTEKNR